MQSSSEVRPDEENFVSVEDLRFFKNYSISLMGENFRHRRRKPSDQNEAVDTYGDLRKSEVWLKYMPKLFHQLDGENFRHRRRKPSAQNEAVDTYGDLRKSKVYLKYMPKLFHQESMVEIVIVISSSTSSRTRTVSSDVNIVVLVSTARRRISWPSIC